VQFFALLPTAEAEVDAKAAPQVLPEWNDAQGGWDCSGNSSGKRTYKFDPQIGTCILLYTDSPMNKVASWTYPNWNKRSCPGESDGFEGTVEVASPVGKAYSACVPLSSWKALSSSRQDAVSAGEFLKPDSFKSATKDSTEKTVLGGKLEADAKEAAKKADEVKATGGGEAGPVTPVPALGEDSCQAPKEHDNCSDKPNDSEDVKKWREASTEENSCIIGGFFSQYDNPSPRKREGKCNPIRQFPPEPAKAIGKVCPRTQALCNPFLFCVKGQGAMQLHCENLSGKGPKTLTERCEDWRNSGQSGKACDPNAKKEFGDAEWAKAWEAQKKDFEDNFTKRCFKKMDGSKTGGFEELFCKECNVMKRILYKMNKKAIKFGCASKPPTPSPSGEERSAAPGTVNPAGDKVIPPAGDAGAKK
jgi:hypothetical protein